MFHSYHYRPANTEGPDQPRGRGRIQDERSFGRRVAKWVLVGGLTSGVVLLLLAAGVYTYVTRAGIDNATGRTNIAILGVEETAQLSDAIMVLSIQDNPEGPSRAALVSIPRDLSVEIPEHGRHKINAAYSLGERTGYPGGGSGLTAATIEQEFDLPIHYHATLNFDGFKEIINTAGGVDVEVESAIDDPYYPAPGYDGYDPFSIQEGLQHMDGDTALKYARSRKTTNDFDRSHRQQQVLLALRDKLLGPHGYPENYLTTIRFLGVVDNHVDINATKLELATIVYKLRGVEVESIPRYVIDTSNFLTSPSGSSVLVPRTGNFEDIRRFLDDIFQQQSVEEFSRQF